MLGITAYNSTTQIIVFIIIIHLRQLTLQIVLTINIFGMLLHNIAKIIYKEVPHLLSDPMSAQPNILSCFLLFRKLDYKDIETFKITTYINRANKKNNLKWRLRNDRLEGQQNRIVTDIFLIQTDLGRLIINNIYLSKVIKKPTSEIIELADFTILEYIKPKPQVGTYIIKTLGILIYV